MDVRFLRERFPVRLAVALALVVGVSAFLVGSAFGEISATTGEVHKGAPPASVALDHHQHDDDTGTPSGAHAFEEEQSYTTKGPVPLDVCIPGNASLAICEPNARGGKFDRPTDFPNRGGMIPANTCIDSHMVHADPPGTVGSVYEGEVSFDSQILGVIVTSPKLVASDADPGLSPSTTYGAEATRGLEFGATGRLDNVDINITAKRVKFHFDTRDGTRTELDQIRVITVGDPQKCPGQAAKLTLTPKIAANPVNSQHCVVASVATETGGPAKAITVRFDVEGASEQDRGEASVDGSKTTDQNGIAQHCYPGSRLVGADTIHAYADNDRDGVEDIGTDPSDDATKTWLPLEANLLVVEPKVDENPVDTTHTVTAKVTDAFGNPVPKKKVRFVVAGTTQKSGTQVTDESGQAQFSYTSTKTGADVITAHVDETNPGAQDVGEPADVGQKTWTAGKPATLSLEPKLDENQVQKDHCVVATVKDAFQNPVPKSTVRFEVTGVHQKSGSDLTDEDGQADFCYTSGTKSGVDVIVAFADENTNKVRDTGESAADTATKIWLPLEPSVLTLTPKTAQNKVNEQHCVQAAVTDVFLNPNTDVTVRFIITGTVEKQLQDQTDDGGVAEVCYTSTKPGLDKIHAFADTDDDNQQDPTEPFDDATKLWQPGDPAVVDLKPETSTNEVGTKHCVKAEVRDAFGNPTPDRLMRFDVEGASEEDKDPADEDGSDRTDEGGNADHCYTGPDLPGADKIHAYADNDEDNRQDANEPFDDSTKTWIFPPSTPGCEVTITDGGWITTLTGSKGTFGGNAKVDLLSIESGQQQYVDHSELLPINFHSSTIVAVVCKAEPSGGQGADIYGTGEVNGVGPVDFRIRVRDVGEPGSVAGGGPDTYQIITAAYPSGPEDNPLQGGNIQIHRFP